MKHVCSVKDSFRAASFVLAMLLFVASKVTPWQPVGETHPGLWKVAASPKALVRVETGAHFFAVVSSVWKKDGTDTSVWLNDATVWQGPGSAGWIAVDQDGNWELTATQGRPGSDQVWINGSLTTARGILSDRPGNRFVWIQKEGGKECIVGFSGKVGCAPKIAATKWLHRGIYWVEETDKYWVVRPPGGKPRRIRRPAGKDFHPFLDDFGALWWSDNKALYSEESPTKPKLTAKGDDGLYYRRIPGARSGLIIRRDMPPVERYFPWDRESPFGNGPSYPTQGRAVGVWSIPCGGGILSANVIESPKMADGMRPGTKWIVGVATGKDEDAVFIDCSKSPPQHTAVNSPGPLLSRIMPPVWLGPALPPFEFLGGLGQDGAIMDTLFNKEHQVWTWWPSGPNQECEGYEVSDSVWLNGPPYWTGWWAWKRDRDTITISWVTTPLDPLLKPGTIQPAGSSIR